MKTPDSKRLITAAQKAQFERDGYFILERAFCAQQLSGLREEAARFVEIMDAEMDALGTAQIGITHKDNRYFIGNKLLNRIKLNRCVSLRRKAATAAIFFM